MWALKLDKDGLFITPGQWQFTYGGADNDYGYSVRQTSDGGYIMAGRTQPSGLLNYDGWIVKVDATGTIEWENRYGNVGIDDALYEVLERTGGGYAAGGVRDRPDVVGIDAWVLDLDLTGDIDASCTEITPTAATRTATAVVPGFTGAISVLRIALIGIATSGEVDTTATEDTQCQSHCAPLTP